MKSPRLRVGNFKTNFFHSDKFQLFSCSEVFSPKSYRVLQSAFENLHWKKKQTEFYSQFELLITPSSKKPFSLLYRKEFYYPFKKKLESYLKVSLRNDIRIIAHKLVTADKIGIHNDFNNLELGYEHYRFIFQFAMLNALTTGGELCFLKSTNENDLIKKYSHNSNTGICFQITPHSYHYVNPVIGKRFTLVMYLWNHNLNYDGSGFEVV